MGEVAAQAVELPDDEHVALPQGAQAAVESRPVVAYAGGEVVVDVDRVDARGPQGVALQVQRLGAVGLGDAGVGRSACVANGRLGHEGAGGFRRALPRIAGRVPINVTLRGLRVRNRPRPAAGQVAIAPNSTA